ncbi:MAG: DeoR/GlpR family DNA-binding transcription regulator [Ilumatobacteraceae bacterium]
MQRPTRWTALLDMLAGDGRVEIDTAAEQLGVSAATVRRDLDELASQQLLVRTRGGAVPTSVSYDLPLRYKLTRRPDEKRAIAAAAADLVVPGSVVGLNGGTTTTEVARAVALRPDLRYDGGEANDAPVTVVTNALNIAHELAVRPQVKLVMTGGVVRAQSYELAGPLAMPVLERLTLDLAILGVDAISVADGATTNNETEAAVNDLMTQRARTVVVVADSSKLGRRAFARICPIDRVDILVTGATGDGTQLAELRAAGIDVMTVGLSSRS